MSDEGSGEGLAKDRSNILLLLLLYVLQGIPLGLAGSIPMILQNRHVTYKEQVWHGRERCDWHVNCSRTPMAHDVFQRCHCEV